MQPRIHHVLFSVLAALLAATVHGQSLKPKAAPPAGPRPTPAAAGVNRPVPFRPGETLTYDIAWSNYLTAGVAEFTVFDARPFEGSTAYYIVGEAKPTGLVSSLYTLYYKADTMLDARSLLPHRSSVYTQEGSRKRTKVTRFDHAALRADFEVRAATVAKSSTALPKDTQDLLSAVYVLRAVPLRPNDRFTMPVWDGSQVYRVKFSVGGVESVRTGSTVRSAYRITPTVTDAKGRGVGRPMTLWLSADAAQVPVKLQADLAVGSVVLTLRGSR